MASPAARLAAVGIEPAPGVLQPILSRFTIRPPPRSRIEGMHSFASRIAPYSFRSRSTAQVSISWLSISPDDD